MLNTYQNRHLTTSESDHNCSQSIHLYSESVQTLQRLLLNQIIVSFALVFKPLLT